MNTHWIAHEIGLLRGTVSEGMQGLHRRIDDGRRETRRQIQDLRRDVCHMKKRTRGGKPLWLHLVSMGVIVTMGLVGLMKPETVREHVQSAIIQMITR